MRKISLLLLSIIPLFGLAQNPGTLAPTGPIPQLYSCPSHVTVENEVARRNAAGDPVSPEEQKFMYEMLYYSQQRMFSGFVLFNDSLSEYVERVGAEVLKDDTATLHKLHFYVFKSSVPNAYTSASGTIMMTVGLLAQLENEAQLAFVLCHEITHFRREHMLKGYLNREELRKKENTPGYLLQNSYFNYNQEQELEADRLGLELFLKSKYNKREALRVLDVLEYSDLPFDDMPYDTLFFNIGYTKIPTGYYKGKTDPIYSDDNYDDRHSTHPNVRKRRTALLPILDTITNKDGASFVVSKDEFLRVREKSRYELCRLYLEERRYCDAIYASYMMLQRHPKDIFFHDIIGKSLYNLAAYNQSSSRGFYGGYDMFLGGYGMYGAYGGRYASLKRSGYYRTPDSKNFPGQQQQIYHLFGEIEADELTVLAITYNWQLYKQQPNDSLQKRICENLLYMLVNKQNLHISYFSKISPDQAKEELRQDSIRKASETGETSDSKFSRLDKFKLNSEKERFIKFAFVDMMKDTLFLSRLKYYSDNRESMTKETDFSMYDSHSKKERKAEEEQKEQYGYGISKVIVVAPDFTQYRQIKRREDTEQEFKETENGAIDLSTVITTAANAEGVQTVVLNPYTMDSLAGDSFADMASLNEWLYEKMMHGSHDHALNVSNQAEIDSIIKKYGTRYVMFTSVEISYYKKIQHPVWFGISCLAVVPAIRAFIPRQRYYYDVAILDLKTGQVIQVEHIRKKKGKEKAATASYYKKIFAKMKKPKKPEEKKGEGGKPVTEGERGM
jgi:beta-barrel assembly-enhancing protease